MAYKILIATEDNYSSYARIKAILIAEGYKVSIYRSLRNALGAINKKETNVIIADMALSCGTNPIDFLRQVKARSPQLEIIFLSSQAPLNIVVNVMKAGAYDFLETSVDPNILCQIIKKAMEKQRLHLRKVELENNQKNRSNFPEIIGHSRGIRRVTDIMNTISGKKSTVLIYGKSGTGKELVAKGIHYNSPKWDKPFIKVNCAALNEGVLESELFGHEKGAFTGAIKRRTGRFELSDGGTLFLDEIADIPLSTQVKLLRVLQEREFERVGGDETIKVDVRIISATNKDLKKAVDAGDFREDLYYRLNVVNITVPPLEERKEDIPLLVDHFVYRHNEENENKIKGFSKEAMRILKAYHWPGNVRELENAIESSITLSNKDILEAKYLPSFLFFSKSESDNFYCIPQGLTLREMEKEIIKHTLERCGGNKTKSAKTLGIGLRTLQRKVQDN